MKNHIAVCGLDCEKCDAYIATKNNDQALREKTAKLWSEMNHTNILPEQINCEGCRMNGRKTVFCDHLCQIRQCALSKGLETCGACPEKTPVLRLALYGNTIRRQSRTLKDEKDSVHTDYLTNIGMRKRFSKNLH